MKTDRQTPCLFNQFEHGNADTDYIGIQR